MTSPLIPASAIREVNDEPRVEDVLIAEYLGMPRPRDIRARIKANFNELSLHGEVCEKSSQTSVLGGRPATTFYLNEPQALLLCMWANTEKAVEVRKLLIDVFMAWRQGKVVDVRAHYRRAPMAPIFRVVSNDSNMATVQITIPLSRVSGLIRSVFALG